MKDFDREAALLASITHNNIVKFYGACIDETPWKMIFEFMEVIKYQFHHSFLLLPAYLLINKTFLNLQYGDLNEVLRMRGPDSHLLAARHDPAIIPHCSSLLEENNTAEPPHQLSLLNLLQISKDISAGMHLLATSTFVDLV